MASVLSSANASTWGLPARGRPREASRPAGRGVHHDRGAAKVPAATARAVKHAVLTGYSARDFRDLVGSGRLAEAIRRPSYGAALVPSRQSAGTLSPTTACAMSDR